MLGALDAPYDVEWAAGIEQGQASQQGIAVANTKKAPMRIGVTGLLGSELIAIAIAITNANGRLCGARWMKPAAPDVRLRRKPRRERTQPCSKIALK